MYKKLTIDLPTAATLLDNLAGIYRHAKKLASEGRATLAAQWLITAYENTEKAMKEAK